MIDIVRHAARLQPARLVPGAPRAPVVTGPLVFNLPPPAADIVFDHEAPMTLEDMMVLAEAAAQDHPRVAPAYAAAADDGDPAPYLDDFMNGMHAPGMALNRRA